MPDKADVELATHSLGCFAMNSGKHHSTLSLQKETIRQFHTDLLIEHLIRASRRALLP